MIYLITSVSSLIMLCVGFGVIVLTIRPNTTKILHALTKRPSPKQASPSRVVLYHTQVRTPIHYIMMPLRAAA